MFINVNKKRVLQGKKYFFKILNNVNFNTKFLTFYT